MSLDSTIVLSRKIAEQGIRPAVDLNLTTSSLLTPDIVGDRHYDLSVTVMALLRKYESLKSIIAIIGENELSPADRADYAKAKKLITNFTQNMNVMEKHIGIPGETYTREQTLDSIEAILNGAEDEDGQGVGEEAPSDQEDTSDTDKPDAESESSEAKEGHDDEGSDSKKEKEK